MRIGNTDWDARPADANRLRMRIENAADHTNGLETRIADTDWARDPRTPRTAQTESEPRTADRGNGDQK